MVDDKPVQELHTLIIAGVPNYVADNFKQIAVDLKLSQAKFLRILIDDYAQLGDQKQLTQVHQRVVALNREDKSRLGIGGVSGDMYLKFKMLSISLQLRHPEVMTLLIDNYVVQNGIEN